MEDSILSRLNKLEKNLSDHLKSLEERIRLHDRRITELDKVVGMVRAEEDPEADLPF